MSSDQTSYEATLNMGPHTWQACTLNSSDVCGSLSEVQNFIIQEATMGFLAKTEDNPTVYWIMYGKKWKIVDQTTFYGLGYIDGQIQLYGEGALDNIPNGKDILHDNDGFCYRSYDDPTVFVIECGESHPFFQWDNFLEQGYNEEDIFWVSPQGMIWIQDQSRFPQDAAPMIRTISQSLNFWDD